MDIILELGTPGQELQARVAMVTHRAGHRKKYIHLAYISYRSFRGER